jgi:hypothetical protein
MKDLIKKFNMAERKPMSTLMSTAMSLEYMCARVQEHDWLPHVPHGDMAGHSVSHVHVCMISSFPMLFTSDDSSANLQVSQTYS